MAWASSSDLLSVVGTISASGYLTLASGIVDVYANRTQAASAGMSARDLEVLKRATCYQAAWLPSQPDILTRVNVDSSTVDGESVKFASESQQNLAPMAARALRNLSWKGSRTLVVPSVDVPLGASRASIDFTSESSDESSNWEE